MKKTVEKLKLILIIGTLLVANILVFIGMGPTNLAPWLLMAGILSLPLLLKRSSGKCQDFLVWSHDYSVGVKEFDEDHKKLLNLINNLKAAVLCNTGEEFERHNLKEMLDYTRHHLKREEELMEQYGYPDFEGHKAQHDQMIGYVEGYAKKYEEKGQAILPEIAEYLTLWLTQHIYVTDMKYTAFLNERGVE
jgi:hemerythrin